MSIPKRKTNINVYSGKELTERRQELLDMITKSDTYLPDGILHDDLDLGMLDFVKGNFKVISDGEQIPIIPRILTIQRWGEITNEWTFSDEDRNIKVPFISVIRKPDVQPGTNPVTTRTIPDRRQFFYASVKTWDGNNFGTDIYKMPQPVAIDIGYEVIIVCHKFRDLNRFNKIVLQKFSSRQAYTMVKGHYIPIILDRNSDNSPIDSIDGRRFYLQTYEFTMLGFLIDPEEFEVIPGVNKVLLVMESNSKSNIVEKQSYYKSGVEVTCTTLTADGKQLAFSVEETIGHIFYVTVNGIIQEYGTDYYNIGGTSKITFINPPECKSSVTICYYNIRNKTYFESCGYPYLVIEEENFTYTGSSLSFETQYEINSVVYTVINGSINFEDYEISGDKEITLLVEPPINSSIDIIYFRLSED